MISFGLNWLPADARTLLETPTKVQIVDLANGKVWYSGLEKNFREIFSKLSENMQLILNFNVDGLPLHNSSKDEFWPILGNFHSNNSFNQNEFVVFFKDTLKDIILILCRLSIHKTIHCVDLVWCRETKSNQ